MLKSEKSANFANECACKHGLSCEKMNTTIRHISHLLRDCDVIAVPGLGVFRRRTIGARFEGSVLLPPSEEVVFVAHDSCDDNMLAMSIARCLACEPAEAYARIADDVADIRARLEAGHAVAIGDAGALVATQALGGISFEMSDRWRRLSPLSWLSPVEPVSVGKAEVPVVEEADTEAEERRRNIFMHSLQRTASSAAAIALLVLIAFVASQLPRKSASEPQMAGFGFERVEPSPVVDPLAQPASDKALVLILNTPADGMSIVDPSEKKERRAPQQLSPSDSYFLIVASLASADEAGKFISSYPSDLGLGIIESSGRWRVYAASGATFADTKAVADSKGLFDRFPTAWICHN